MDKSRKPKSVNSRRPAKRRKPGAKAERCYVCGKDRPFTSFKCPHCGAYSGM